MKTKNNEHDNERRWVLFSNGCFHGIRHSEVTVLRSKPHRSMTRSSVAVFSVSRLFAVASGIGLILVLLLLAACAMPQAQKGGAATSVISRPGQANSATLTQSDNPKQPSRQTVQSEQSLEYVLPAGTTIELPGSNLTPGTPCVTREFGMLRQSVPVKMTSKDRTETSIGGAQKDTMREWAGKAANMQPVMWAGVIMMTLVAGALLYFGWWTKAMLAGAVGLAMVVLAQTLPDHGAVILLGGLGTFGLVALLILYAYHKGQLDKNHNGIPDELEKGDHVPF
jgi:hypothetical protein